MSSIKCFLWTGSTRCRLSSLTFFLARLLRSLYGTLTFLSKAAKFSFKWRLGRTFLKLELNSNLSRKGNKMRMRSVPGSENSSRSWASCVYPSMMAVGAIKCLIVSHLCVLKRLWRDESLSSDCDGKQKSFPCDKSSTIKHRMCMTNVAVCSDVMHRWALRMFLQNRHERSAYRIMQSHDWHVPADLDKRLHFNFHSATVCTSFTTADV